MIYEEFVARKLSTVPPTGCEPPTRLPGLFPFQSDLVRWALRRGRAAIFAGTGLGKTRMQLSWAKHVAKVTGRDVLVLAPLAVAQQTAAEAPSVGASVTVCREPGDVRRGVNVTNYDRMHRFDAGAFGAVVLDESSCIKHHDTKTLATLLSAFRDTPYKLACTATPAPNDWTELGTHAEFLGICTRAEMLSEFFCHDGGDTQTWRLKGHARSVFWRWVASWGAMVSHPRDLGYEVDGYDLPPLTIREHLVRTGAEAQAGFLFAQEAASLMERRQARKASLSARVEACAELVGRERWIPIASSVPLPTSATARQEQWIVWCDLNAEQDALAAALGDEAVSIYGSLDSEEKERRYWLWASGERRVLVSKPSMFGYGVNMQHAARMAFVGVTDSWEAYYQAVRRCWRFGQRRPVEVHVFASEAEGSVVANLKRKEADAAELAAALASETADAVRAQVRGLERATNPYQPTKPMEVPAWLTAQ